MEILSLRFQNLNSLTGEWEIDLQHPSFVDDGIFAITGPTGAGKSTILDAICLALYGRTPRLDRVNKSTNEIMSRHSGECFAEVTFRTQRGVYRCHWSQHRAFKKPDGELQNQKHEISDAETGRDIETKLRDVLSRIEDVTGMDYERFTRSMLLAQGGFAAFLKADSDERAPILEQLTGTKIYSDISMHVHERYRAERDKLANLKAQLDMIKLLDADTEAEYRQRLAASEQEAGDIERRTRKIRAGLEWLERIASIKSKLSEFQAEMVELDDRIESFNPQQERLARAVAASEFDADYATLTGKRTQLSEDMQERENELQQLPRLKQEAKDRIAAFKEAERLSAARQAELESQAPLIAKVRELDQQLKNLHGDVSKSEEKLAAHGKRIAAKEKSRKTLQDERAQAAAKLEKIGRYLTDHKQDEWLVEHYAAVAEQLKDLLQQEQEISRQESRLKKAATELKKAKASFAECKEQHNQLQRDFKAATSKHKHAAQEYAALLDGRSLREYRSEKDALQNERALRLQIAKLEEMRDRLVDGEPCPLCGATEHPFAEGNVPLVDEIDRRIMALENLIENADQQESAVEQLDRQVESLGQQLKSAAQQMKTADKQQKAAEQNIGGEQERLTQLESQFTERQQAVADSLEPLGIGSIDTTEAEQLLTELQGRRDTWQSQVDMQVEIRKHADDLDTDIKTLDALIESVATECDAENRELIRIRQQLTSVGDERQELYGDKEPDVEERRLFNAVGNARNEEKGRRELKDEAQRQLDAATTAIQRLGKDIARLQPELEKLEQKFATALRKAGFDDETAFVSARLSIAERRQLKEQADKLKERKDELNALLQEHQRSLEQESTHQLTTTPVDELRQQLSQHEQKLEEVRDLKARLSATLQADEKARQQEQASRKAMEKQEAEHRRWRNLHELIGSADGKKFRNFAQGLTFEIMISHANHQLAKMTDRYLLVRDEENVLELDVIDNYQAGEVRSTKNLSGGESFIVSLALALGLSQMASRKVRVDSLFLDEGFGTLDEEALDTALETLAGLKQTGKLIGVISHVPALKERIATQIRVEQRTGGNSVLSGPGCVCCS